MHDLSKYECFPFFYPTQVMVLDDNLRFLNKLTIVLPKNRITQYFSSVTEAKNFILKNSAANFSNALLKNYANLAEFGLPAEKYVLDKTIVFEALKSPDRFSEVSLIIADNVMPELSGIEFFRAIKNIPIKRVLFSGESEESEIITAFNQHIINQYIAKSDPKVFETFKKYYQEIDYFYFNLILGDKQKYLGHFHFLNDEAFSKYFYQLREDNKIIEYYLIDPGKILCINHLGEPYLLLVETDVTLLEHLKVAEERGAPKALLDVMHQGNKIPFFPTADYFYSPEILEWEPHLYPQTIVSENWVYACTFIKDFNFPHFNKETIYPYSKFLKDHYLNLR